MIGMITRLAASLRFALAAAMLLTFAAASAAAEDFYAGKQLTIIVGAGPGGGYDLQARVAARHLGRHIPGNPTIIVQNMPSRIAAANNDVQHRDEGRHHHRTAAARRAARQADLSVRRALRDREIPLARQPQQRDRGDACLAHRSAQDREGSVRQGADRRRHRRRRSGDDAAALQLADRHQIQGRQRLQQHRADRARDRARRGAGHRRLVVVEPEGGAAAMARRQAGHAADAGRAEERAGARRRCRTRWTSSRTMPTARCWNCISRRRRRPVRWSRRRRCRRTGSRCCARRSRSWRRTRSSWRKWTRPRWSSISCPAPRSTRSWRRSPQRRRRSRSATPRRFRPNSK